MAIANWLLRGGRRARPEGEGGEEEAEDEDDFIPEEVGIAMTRISYAKDDPYRDFRYLWSDRLFAKPYSIAKFRRTIALFLAEFYGIALWTNLGCSTLISDTGPVGQRTFNVMMTFTFGSGMAIWIVYHISGSLMNPALTMAALILGHISIYRLFLYTLAQFMGATFGIWLNRAFVPHLMPNYCMIKFNPLVPIPLEFGFEIFMSALLCWCLCGLLDRRRIRSFKNFSIKFIVTLAPLLLNFREGLLSIINPAFALANAINSGDYHQIYVEMCGPVIGCVLWAVFYRGIFDYSIESKSKAKKLYNIVE